MGASSVSADVAFVWSSAESAAEPTVIEADGSTDTVVRLVTVTVTGSGGRMPPATPAPICSASTRMSTLVIALASSVSAVTTDWPPKAIEAVSTAVTETESNWAASGTATVSGSREPSPCGTPTFTVDVSVTLRVAFSAPLMVMIALSCVSAETPKGCR